MKSKARAAEWRCNFERSAADLKGRAACIADSTPTRSTLGRSPCWLVGTERALGLRRWLSRQSSQSLPRPLRAERALRAATHKSETFLRRQGDPPDTFSINRISRAFLAHQKTFLPVDFVGTFCQGCGLFSFFEWGVTVCLF